MAMNKNIFIYKMNDYEIFASTWSIEKTNNWYIENYGENDLLDVEICDIYNDGSWLETKEIEDIKKLKDYNEIVDGQCSKKPKFGDLREINGTTHKYVSFKEVIDSLDNINEPECIAIADM